MRETRDDGENAAYRSLPGDVQNDFSAEIVSEHKARYPEPLDRTTLGVQHRKLQTGQRMLFTALGHMAHLMRDQAANGVELVG